MAPSHQRLPFDGTQSAENGRVNDQWKYRTFPENGSSILPHDLKTGTAPFGCSPVSHRLDFSAFINTMDDASFAYLSLIREYASRTLQGKALSYSGLYRALVSQHAEDEMLSRVSVIEYQKDGLRMMTFQSYSEFETYLNKGLPDGSLRRLIVLEDLPVRIVCLVGSRLRIHPTIFARQYSTEDSATVSDNITALPSIVQTSTQDGLEYVSDDESLYDPVKKRSFTLGYPIVMPRITARQHPDPLKCPPWMKPSERLNDQSAYPRFIVERDLQTPSSYGHWDTRGETSELQGQVTYWEQTLDEGGWNAVCLVDPCLKDPEHLSVINGAPRPNLSRIIRYPELEDHEKVELPPNPLQWHPSAAFTKYILHDDILIHFSVADTGPGSNPLATTPFIRGFVVSKWVAHLNHLRRSYVHTRAALFSDNHGRHHKSPPSGDTTRQVQHTARWGADWKEWMFETMTRFTTEMPLYRLDVETNMRALGIDIQDPHSYGIIGKREAQMWRIILATCIDLQEMFQQLTNSYTQVVALREAQASNAQAKSVRWLSLLGTFFVPLSVVAGIMSMGGDFLPGEKRFWVYFAVVGPVLPVIGAILVAITEWERGLRVWQKRLLRRNVKDAGVTGVGSSNSPATGQFF